MKNGNRFVWVFAFGMTLMLIPLAACNPSQSLSKSETSTSAPLRSPNAPPQTHAGIFLFTSQSMAQVNLADIEGGEIKALTENPDGVSCPAFSPNGNRIAFCSLQDGANRLYTIASDGSDQKPVTNKIAGCGCSTDAHLSWSPDGQWILLPINEDPKTQQNYDLFAVSVDGEKVINLTGSPQRYGGVIWNPDSKSVLFSGQTDGKNDIYRVSIKDQKITPLTSTPIIGAATYWSPDGQHLLLFADSGDGNFDIFILKAGDKALTRLTDAPGFDDYPIWFPDGKNILFGSSRDGNKELYRMAVDGTGQTNLTNNPDGMDILASLSPDGKKIIYLVSLNNQWSSVVMNADGTGRQNITDRIGIPSTISWMP